MKYLILFALIALAISNPMIGKCQGTPKLRPIECFKGQVLNEDLPELEELLAKYKDGDDHDGRRIKISQKSTAHSQSCIRHEGHYPEAC